MPDQQTQGLMGSAVRAKQAQQPRSTTVAAAEVAGGVLLVILSTVVILVVAAALALALAMLPLGIFLSPFVVMFGLIFAGIWLYNGLRHPGQAKGTIGRWRHGPDWEG